MKFESKEDMMGLCRVIHLNAKEKGFYDPAPKREEVAALFHSEISEAVEEARNEAPPVYYLYCNGAKLSLAEAVQIMDISKEKPEGELIELADLVIRITDWAFFLGTYVLSGWKSFADMYARSRKEAEKLKWNDEAKTPLEFYNVLHRLVALDRSYGTIISRIANYCAIKGWDLEEAIVLKMNYNVTRPYKHGKRI